jgi:hypothetical protein
MTRQGFLPDEHVIEERQKEIIETAIAALHRDVYHLFGLHLDQQEAEPEKNGGSHANS